MTAALLVACFGGLAPIDAHAARGDTILINRQSAADGGAGGNGDSDYGSSMSANGRYVAFASAADNLSSIDGPARDVYVRDTVTGTTELISRRSASDGGAAAAGSSDDPTISDDGRYVAFECHCYNLVDDEHTVVPGVYLRDRKTLETSLVSRADGIDGEEAYGYYPSISADGSLVAFDSSEESLSTQDAPDSFTDIYVRDVVAHKTVLVSRRDGTAGGAGANDSSRVASISEDGDYVAFHSAATNLSGADRDAYYDIFVRHLPARKTVLASRQSDSDGGAGANGNSFGASISNDGRFVAFDSRAGNLSDADGAAVDVFVRGPTGTTTLVSRRSHSGGGAGGNDHSEAPSISGSGRFIAFQSLASNLSTRDRTAFSDVFVRDTAARTTNLISQRDREGGDADSSTPSISDDGRFVGFWSEATNLSDRDRDGVADVFRHDFLGP